MFQKIKETAAEEVDGAKPQCYILFILSHGDEVDNQESVFGTDGKLLTKRRIRDELSGVRNLRGVPRILFFCCCRGSMYSELYLLQ